METVAICWYATAGYQPHDLDDARAPWYRTKAQPSVADMHAKLRRVIITTQFHGTNRKPATPEETNILRLGRQRRITAKVQGSCRTSADDEHTIGRNQALTCGNVVWA